MQRYNVSCDCRRQVKVTRTNSGDWVQHSDHASEVARLEAERDEYHKGRNAAAELLMHANAKLAAGTVEVAVFEDLERVLQEQNAKMAKMFRESDERIIKAHHSETTGLAVAGLLIATLISLPQLLPYCSVASPPSSPSQQLPPNPPQSSAPAAQGPASSPPSSEPSSSTPSSSP